MTIDKLMDKTFDTEGGARCTGSDPEFIMLTSREAGGGELFVRKDMVAAVGSYDGVTHVTLVNDDVDFEVKESVAEVLRRVQGKQKKEYGS